MSCIDQWLITRRPFCPICKRDARSKDEKPAPSESTPLLTSARPSTISSTSVLSGTSMSRSSNELPGRVIGMILIGSLFNYNELQNCNLIYPNAGDIC